MGLTDFVKHLFSKQQVAETSQLSYQADPEGLLLRLPTAVYNQARQGYADNLSLHQYLRMQILLEQELAEARDDGVYLRSEDAVALDPDSRHIFGLPPRWPGRFRLHTSGVSHGPGFGLELALEAETGEVLRHYSVDGPLLRLSAEEVFLPDELQWRALSTVAGHQALPPRQRDEYANLAAVHALLQAAEAGLALERAVFKGFATVAPRQVGLAVELLADGSLELMPTFGEGLDQQAVAERLGQIDPSGRAQSLRVGKTLVLLDEQRLQAAHEVIRKRHIPASQRRKFLAAPAAYLDAALVNLDAGFSMRVKGAGPFLHAYFGETDSNDIQWFAQDGGQLEQDLLALVQETAQETWVQPADLPRLITDPAVLGDLRRKLADAEATNASVLRLDQWHINIEDKPRVRQALDQLDELFVTQPAQIDQGPIALDIHLNDMETEVGGEMNAPPKGIQSQREVDYSAYTRSPFPHQVEGVRWLLALAANEGQPESGQHRIQGGLLADDMGLGKTYMSIVGLREVLLHSGSNKPVLVVAPLSLLENWRREVESTYKQPFFSRIVILQADGDLPKYRIDGRGVETRRRVPHEVELVAGPATIPDDGLPPWDTGADAPGVFAARAYQPAAETLPAADSEGREGLATPLGADAESSPATAAPPDPAEVYALQCALKIGPDWGPDRLDLPRTLVLATYQTLRDYQFSLASVPWSVVVFDEAQNIKSPNTLQTRAAKALNAEFKLMVTGTPVENHLGEFWCLFDTMQPGFLGSYQDFRQTYIRPILQASPDQLDEVRVQVGRDLRDRVGGFMLRRVKEDHLKDMPQKHIILGEYDASGQFVFDPRVSASMNGAQRLRYEDVMQATLDEMENEVATSAALRGLQQLRDVSLHPLLLSEMPSLPRSAEEARELFRQSGKLDIVLRLLDEVREREEKILIFAVNKRLQELVAVCISRLYGLPIAIINGTTKAVSNNPNNPTRQTIIDRFQATEGFNALVISPVAAGVGLTITAANHVIHLERHWNPAKEAQATDRAYRIGQTKDVYVYIPVLTHPDYDSFDVNLNRLLSSKMSLKDAIITQEEVSGEELLQRGLFQRKKNSPEKI